MWVHVVSKRVDKGHALIVHVLSYLWKLLPVISHLGHGVIWQKQELGYLCLWLVILIVLLSVFFKELILDAVLCFAQQLHWLKSTNFTQKQTILQPFDNSQ